MKEKKRLVKLTDNLLVRHAQRGDKHAFDFLMHRYYHRLLRLLARYIYNPQDIQEIAQEVMLKAYCSIDQFRGESAFYTWLYRIAINTAKNYLIGTSRQPYCIDMEMDLLEFLRKELATPEHLLISDELKRLFFDQLAALNKDIRLAFILWVMEDLSYEDIADVLGCPIGTVRSRISRAKECVEGALLSHLES